jgi:peptidoglycan hydrolase CwlO-like protein
MPEVNPTVLALIGTVMGGSGLKITESILSKRKTQADEATTIRTELRTEVENLRKLMKEAEGEVDEWRNKYYALVSEVAGLRAEAEAAAALAKLKAAESEKLRAEAEAKAKVPAKRTPRKKPAPKE